MKKENKEVEDKSSEHVSASNSEENVLVEEQPISILPSELKKRLGEEFQKGSNMLYSELIGYLFVQTELFANQFKPENATYENFLGFVINTIGQEYNKKYVKQPEVSDEKKQADGQAPEGEKRSEEGQGQNEAEPKEGEEASKERCKDVQKGSVGGQEANQETECEEEVK